MIIKIRVECRGAIEFFELLCCSKAVGCDETGHYGLCVYEYYLNKLGNWLRGNMRLLGSTVT